MPANSQTEPTNLFCESASRLLLSSPVHPLSQFSIIIIIIIISYNLLLSPKTDTHFTIPQRVKGWVDLGS